MELNRFIDHTLLSASATEADILNLCEEALKYKFYSVCVNSNYVTFARQALGSSDVKVCTVVGFPLGAMSTDAKAYEAKKAVEHGASEIDMVINIGRLKSNNHVEVLKDINAVKRAIGHIPLKVILEISELSKNEIVRACEICIDAKADFVKTSTGFATAGAKVEDVSLMRKVLPNKVGIKATGGIRTLDDVLQVIRAGADVVGTSSAPQIIDSLQ